MKIGQEINSKQDNESQFRRFTNDFGFSIESFREANKLRIYDLESDSPVKIFEGYYQGGTEYNLKMDLGDFMSALDSKASGIGGLARNLMQGIGAGMGQSISGAIDFNMSPFLKGIEPLHSSYEVILPVLTDFNSDVREPLKELIKFFLPDRSQVSQELKGKIEEDIRKGIDLIGSVWEPAQKALDAMLNNYTRGAFLLTNPKQLKNPGKMVLMIGSIYRLEGIMISGVDIKFGPNVYADDNGYVYPAYAKVALDIQALVKPTLSTFKI